MAKSASLRAASLREALVAWLVLTAVILALLSLSAVLAGTDLGAAAHAVAWLASLEREDASGKLSDAAAVVAGVLGIAITVVALVVQLAATRSGHRITSMFTREPVNRVVMSLFVLTTLQCLWISVTLDDPNPDAMLPNAGFAITMALITISLLVLLPYFIFVFSFLSPLSMIEQLRRRATRALSRTTRDGIATCQSVVTGSIDELQEVARSAIEKSDRAVAIACIDALAELLFDYQRLRARLPVEWFHLGEVIRRDPDFVSWDPSSLAELEHTGLWFEVKVLHQYRELMSSTLPHARDVADMIAINSGRIGVAAADVHPGLVTQCIRCFNTYLRTTIRANDMRTGVNVLNQYRLVAEALLARGRLDAVRQIADFFRLYGAFAYREGQSFILEVAAHDLVQLIGAAVTIDSPVVDDLLGRLLELDQEVRQESQEASLMGVRRAQIQLATLFIERGDEERARRIVADLACERRERLERVRADLLADQPTQYWEFTPRGLNFAHLAPERRRHLATLFGWLDNPEVITAQ
jgi:hypothetical protein